MTQTQAGPEEEGPSPGRRLNYFKLGFLLIVGLYGAVCALNPSTPRFLLLNRDQTLGNLAPLVGLAARSRRSWAVSPFPWRKNVTRGSFSPPH